MGRQQKSLFTLFALLLGATTLFGQAKRSEIAKYEPTWNDGEITLADGSKVSGYVSFNDNDGIVSLKEDGEIHSFKSNDLLGFQFYDSKTMRDRVFFVMEFTDSRDGIARFSFFEVLKEFPSFAVLAKIDRIGTEVQRGVFGLPTSPALKSKSSNNVVASQTETIYFMSEAGDMVPYLQIVEKETEGEWFDYNRTKNSFIEKDVFERYTTAYYPELEEFAKTNGLSFKRKSDLIKILDQYHYLLSH
ncbi:MAG TPA: hypothetical protein VGD40_10725 [Chryseosolibacter sp.]